MDGYIISNIYSTTEHFTSKYWIDEKPIYSIVIENPIVDTTLLTGIEEIISYKVKRTYSSTQQNLFVYYEGTTSTNLINIQLLNGDVSIKSHSGGFNSVIKWCYLEYTKSTT